MKKVSVLLSFLLIFSLLLAACGGAPAASTPAEVAVADTAEADTTAADAAAAVPGGEVPRNRTMVVADMSPYGPPEMWSPYNLGGTHQQGVAFFHEPLVYADMLDGHQYPWLATSWNTMTMLPG
ncbi:MAG: hypothetical protein R2932_15135 [Caldilineaceae bacterium]